MYIVTAEPRAAQRRRNRRHPPRSIHQGLFTFSRAIFFQNSNLFLIIAWTELLAVRDDESRCFVRPFRRHFRQLEFPLFLPGRRNLVIHERYLTRWDGETVGAHRFAHPSHCGSITIKWKYANAPTATGTRMLRRSQYLHGSVPRLTVSFATVEKEEPVVLFPQKHYRSQSPSARRLHPRVEK